MKNSLIIGIMLTTAFMSIVFAKEKEIYLDKHGKIYLVSTKVKDGHKVIIIENDKTYVPKDMIKKDLHRINND